MARRASPDVAVKAFRDLKAGDQVEVFVPWQMFKEQPYWEGEITGFVMDRHHPSARTLTPGVLISRRLNDHGGYEESSRFHPKFVHKVGA